MTAVKASIEIAVPPDAVWDVIMDPDHFDDWVTIHRKLGHVDDGPLREGFEVEQTLCLHRANFKVKWSLARVRRPAPRGVGGQGPGRAPTPASSTPSSRSTAASARASTTSTSTRSPGGFLGRMAGRVLVAGSAEKEANRSLERLKAFLENGRP